MLGVVQAGLLAANGQQGGGGGVFIPSVLELYSLGMAPQPNQLDLLHVSNVGNWAAAIAGDRKAPSVGGAYYWEVAPTTRQAINGFMFGMSGASHLLNTTGHTYIGFTGLNNGHGVRYNTATQSGTFLNSVATNINTPWHLPTAVMDGSAFFPYTWFSMLCDFDADKIWVGFKGVWGNNPLPTTPSAIAASQADGKIAPAFSSSSIGVPQTVNMGNYAFAHPAMIPAGAYPGWGTH